MLLRRTTKEEKIELIAWLNQFGLYYRICIMVINAWYGCDHSEIVHPLHSLLPLHGEETEVQPEK